MLSTVLRLAGRREDRDAQALGRRQRQLVQIVAAVEGARIARRTRVARDLSTEDTAIHVRIEDLQPAVAARRNRRREARRGAREAVAQERLDLAGT